MKTREMQLREAAKKIADEIWNQDEQGGCVFCGSSGSRSMYATDNPKDHSSDCPWIQLRYALLGEGPAPAGEPQPQAPKVICDIEKKPHERDAVTKCRNPRPAPSTEGPEERK